MAVKLLRYQPEQRRGQTARMRRKQAAMHIYRLTDLTI
jgi:hypothetical protein